MVDRKKHSRSPIDFFQHLGSVDFRVLLSRFSTSKNGGNIHLRIWPPFFESKIGQNNPEKRRTLGVERSLWTLCLLLLGSLHGERLFAEELEEHFLVLAPPHEKLKAEEGYTINFNNVSITEYIRFVSKIFNVNFIFEQKDLDFTVTIVSEDPVSAKNVMSALVQVLRVHDLNILEQDNNLLITKNPDVNQIANIVSNDLPHSTSAGIPLITRVFRIKNANLATLTTILKPMTSKSALIETSVETRQLIVTDITTNVEKIAQLLASLDAPHSPLEFESYTAQNIPLVQLITLAQQIITPFVENNPHIMVPQTDTNTIFIVSTPYLIDKTIALLKDLDIPIAAWQLSDTLPPTNFYIYTPKSRSGPEIVHSFNEIGNTLRETGFADPALLQTLSTIRWEPSTNSLVFTGSEKSLEEVKALLTTVDSGAVKEETEATFYLYKLQHVQGPEALKELQRIGEDLSKSPHSNAQELSSIMRTIRWIKEGNFLLITGNKEGVEHVKELITQLDRSGRLSTEIDASRGPTTFIIYNPQYQSGPDLISILQDFAQNLAQCSVADPALFEAIDNLTWIERTNSLLISGDAASIEKIKELLDKFDVAGTSVGNTTISSLENTNFLVYKLQYHKGAEITAALKQIATDVASSGPSPNQDLLNAVNSIQWISVTNSLIASGNQQTLTKLRSLIENLDAPLRQVFIEVLIIQTSLNNSQNFGLQWGGKAQYLDRFALGTSNLPADSVNASAINSMPGLSAVNGSLFPDASLMIPPGFGTPAGLRGSILPGFDLGVIGDIILHKGRSFISLGSLIDALQRDRDTTVVMNPKIITQDNNNSTIFVGQNIPFTSAVVQNQIAGTAGSLSTVNIEYRDVGVNLSITPILGNNDIVTLQIMNDITQQTANTLALAGGGANNITGLQTTHTNMSTRVTVPDRHFLILSGMIRDTSDHYKSSIPCLGGLPLVGAAFSSNQRTRDKNNIIIFVRPQIINSFADYSKITDHQENLFEESAFLPAVQEAFEAAIDLVKTPEDEHQ